MLAAGSQPQSEPERDLEVSDGATRWWELLDFSSAERRTQSLRCARTIAPKTGPGARSFDLEWKLGPDPDWSRVRVYVLREGPVARGLAMFILRDWPLVFRLGEIAIGSARLDRWTTVGDVHIDPGLDVDARAAAAAQLLSAVLASLRSSEALFFEGLPVTRPTYGLLAANNRRTNALTIQMGAAYDHQFIAFPPSFEEYLQQLGSRSRQSLKYSARKLDKDMDGQVQLVKFADAEGAIRFLTDAAAISRKTYQTKLLGLGIRDDSKARARLSQAAAKGWLRSYILYCKDTPAAFMLGFDYGGCYYYDDVGYDPDYAKWSVGSVLQIKVIEEIMGSQPRIEHFDFSTGFGQHKGRFGNEEQREVNLLVLRRTARNQVLASAYRCAEWFGSTVVSGLDRLGVKGWLKNLVRGRGRV
ncbi:MAG: GNAT family N-acetyltransferase [Burkholderiaceae bacterium]|nr:GNAT family N-acetyltransferase [Burkholderiaceae bacterium]